jgi:hypothetical protein
LEEQEEYARQLEKKALEAQIRQRLDLQNAHKSYLEMKEQKKQAEMEEEAKFRSEMMAKFAEDDRLEQLSAQKRRMKQLEHRKEVERLIKERQEEYERQKDFERQEYEEEERQESIRRSIIEKERQRLLHEHATKLLGYLPKGVFRDGEELSLIGDGFNETKRVQFDNSP